MKRMFFTIPLLAAALLTSAQTTQKLTAGKANEYGLIYTLPVTVIAVTVAAEKTVRQPGDFIRYAKEYLGMDPIVEPSVTCRLKSVTITTRGVADNEERYLVQFKSGSTPFMILSDTDFPLAINTEAVAAATAAQLPQPREAGPTILETPAATQAMTAEMLQSTSSAKRAELAAARIFELRQSRSDIISGSADNMPSDGQAMQLALDNLNNQEAALTAMFLGTEQTSTQVATFTAVPPAGNDQSWQCVIARLSSLDGIVDADDLSGDPIHLTVNVTSRGTLPKNEKGEEKRFPKGGLAYRIPGTAEVTASFMGSDVAATQIDVAQYGVVFGLDPNLFTNKREPAYATFNPVTGAIREIGSVTPAQ